MLLSMCSIVLYVAKVILPHITFVCALVGSKNVFALVSQYFDLTFSRFSANFPMPSRKNEMSLIDSFLGLKKKR